MLIDATHAEETRVAVIDGHKLVEFDYESQYRKPLKGSIFLAKVTRVEPSLQAAFVNFGGNRHGFLPFSEIHPDYFRIPISDREALIAEQEELLREAEEEEQERDKRRARQSEEHEHASDDDEDSEENGIEEIGGEVAPLLEDEEEAPAKKPARGRKKKDEPVEEVVEEIAEEAPKKKSGKNAAAEEVAAYDDHADDESGDVDGNSVEGPETHDSGEFSEEGQRRGRGRGGRGRGRFNGRGRGGRAAHRSRQVEVLGGTEYEEGDQSPSDRARFALRRKYKIQEVIKRGQIMLGFGYAFKRAGL
ncbi:MAG TPA: S1 RNA-binding domain-containing protein, partial [Alphaproteobacteria bacterium]|nr:S1 RNA-binding domain-containing protein [Alphaproteobacteria bacterium]